MPTCQRCLDLEREIAAVRGELTTVGRPVADMETLADNDRELALARWLQSAREPDAAAGFRAGWYRLGRLVSPKFREWQRLWFESSREGDRLRAQVGVLLREISRSSESG